MTTYSYIDFPRGLTRGVRYVPLISIEGVPVLLVPDNLHPTDAAFSGTPDPLWWFGATSGSLLQDMPGGGSLDPVYPLLDPSVTWEVYEEARILDGDVKVDPVTFDVYDVDGVATGLLSSRNARFAQLLAAEIGPADTLIPLVSSSGAPLSGIACIGRETVLYSGIGSDNLVIGGAPDGRGRFGSIARRHTAPLTHQPLVVFAGPRFWQGRLAVLWIAALSVDGTTVQDPTPLFLGTVGAGIQLTRKGMRWSIPLDPITDTYTRAWVPRTVDLWGIGHFYPDVTQPLQIGWTGDTYLDSTSDSINNGGWHPDWDAFVQAMADRALVTEPGTLRISMRPHLTIYLSGGASPTLLTIFAAWATPYYVAQNFDTDGTYVSPQDPPSVCVHLDGKIRLGTAGDIDKVPATLSWTVSTPAPGTAYLSLSAKTDHHDGPVSARILDRDGANGTLTVQAQFSASETDLVATTTGRQQQVLITRRTVATIGVVATGATALGALRALAGALDEIAGNGGQDSGIDWDDLQRQFSARPFVIETREYRVSKGDTLLDFLLAEMRLRGMAMCLRYGRITAYRPASFASTEAVRATITETDVLTDPETGELAEWDVIDNSQPLATSVLFELGDGSSYQWIDTTFQDELGDGAQVKCDALKHLPPETDLPNLATALQMAAWQLLGPLAEPSRIVRLQLPPTFLSLQPGDLVSLTHPMVPNWNGTRGVSDLTCQVAEARKQLWGGKARAILGLRLQSTELAGYAPEALVAVGGLDHASHVITLDTASGFGASCFAKAFDANGAAVTDPLDGYEVGDHVVLSEIDSETPAADEAFIITAIDTVLHTVTLDGFPSLLMAALAAAEYKVILRFDLWPGVAVRQQRFAFIADATTGEFSDGDVAKRWAA